MNLFKKIIFIYLSLLFIIFGNNVALAKKPDILIQNFEGTEYIGWTWNRVSTDKYEGAYSMTPFNIGTNGPDRACHTINVNVVSGYNTISFYMKYDIQMGGTNEYMAFLINGVEQNRWRGTEAWKKYNYSLSQGQNTIEFCNNRGRSIQNLNNKVWVDYIVLSDNTSNEEEEEEEETPEEPNSIVVENYEGNSNIGWGWNKVTNEKYEGTYSIKASNTGTGGSERVCSSVIINATDSYNILSFYMKYNILIGGNNDYMTVLINGVEQNRWRGFANWKRYNFTLAPGQYTIEFCNNRGRDISNVDNHVWVDYITLSKQIEDEEEPPEEEEEENPEDKNKLKVEDYEGNSNIGSGWARVTSEKYEGTYSIKATNTGTGGAEKVCSSISLNVPEGYNKLSFFIKYDIRTGGNNDYASFLINSIEQQRYTGISNWQEVSLLLATGQNQIQFCNNRGRTIQNVNNHVWVDNIFLTKTEELVGDFEINIKKPNNDNLVIPSSSFVFLVEYKNSAEKILKDNIFLSIRKKENNNTWSSPIEHTGSVENITNKAFNYNINFLTPGIYKISILAYNNIGVQAFDERIFMIDKPSVEMIQGNLQIGKNKNGNILLTDEIVIKVKTIGIPYKILIKKDNLLKTAYTSINDWNNTDGIGYKINSGNIKKIENTKSLIYESQNNINSTGDLQEFTHNISFGGIIPYSQEAGEYEGLIDFFIEFDY